jgi:hypothetical protein
MFKRLAVAAIAAAVVAAASAPGVAAPATDKNKGTAASSAPAAAPAKTKKESAGRTAMHERQKKCGAEWKEAKAAGKIEKGMKWPQYWSACNKRLKGAGT